ncbi:MAG: MFS transporter [Acidimicrobiales bacterium]
MSELQQIPTRLDEPVNAVPDERRWARGRASRWAALPVLMAGTFLFVLDFFIVNVGLPSIQGSLHASQAAIQWMVAGYGLTLSVTLITAGRIGDMIGRRRAFSVGLGVFAAASAACGVAPSAAVLVVSRLVQGVGAAFISSTVLAIIGVVYTGADRPRAISAYGMVMGVAAAGGQVIGGLLIQADIAGSSWPGARDHRGRSCRPERHAVLHRVLRGWSTSCRSPASSPSRGACSSSTSPRPSWPSPCTTGPPTSSTRPTVPWHVRGRSGARC